jgi:hypothetical protein
MAQGCGNGLTSNLSAFAKSARTDADSESHDNMDLLLLGDIGKEVVEAEPDAPCTPILPAFGLGGPPIHRCIVNLSPTRSVEITLALISDASWMNCHSHICGKGERERRHCWMRLESRYPLLRHVLKHFNDRNERTNGRQCLLLGGSVTQHSGSLWEGLHMSYVDTHGQCSKELTCVWGGCLVHHFGGPADCQGVVGPDGRVAVFHGGL